MKNLKINDKFYSNKSVYIIAEMSCNHHQDIEKAKQIIREIAKSGANAVKTQVANPNTITLDCNKSDFLINNSGQWSGMTLHSLYKECYTPWEWHKDLKLLANSLGLDYFASPFSVDAVDFLDLLGVPAYKVASFELGDFPILKRIAKTGRPVILSTGMATYSEINESVSFLIENGAKEICLLKCTSAYPSPLESMNLLTIPNLSSSFGVSVGLSDHSLGDEAAIASVSLGACVIEKHFIISRTEGGPDSSFSMEPNEFKSMVTRIRNTEKVLGQVFYGSTPAENENLQFKRSLYVIDKIKKGDLFTERNIASIRPGFGLPPKNIYSFLGKKAAFDIDRGTAVTWDMLEGGSV